MPDSGPAIKPCEANRARPPARAGGAPPSKGGGTG